VAETIETKQSWYERHYHLLRRLHSLTGILPIGLFLIVHLTTNSSILWGKLGLRGEDPGADLTTGGVKYFTSEVIWINREVPHLILIEIVLWVSIAFHAILGLVYATSGKPNNRLYPYQDNWRYTLQRISGYVGIVFIFYHVATLRWGWTWLVPGGTQWDYRFASSTLAAALQGGKEGMRLTNGAILVSMGYFIGITMLVFHFANGLWTAAITWGLTVSAQAQRRWGRVCFAIGAGLMVMAWGALFRFATLPYQKARETEMSLHSATPDAATRKADAQPTRNNETPAKTASKGLAEAR
jgi:succinate dehydrogenase / fumarate reductase cytochrome b subunit